MTPSSPHLSAPRRRRLQSNSLSSTSLSTGSPSRQELLFLILACFTTSIFSPLAPAAASSPTILPQLRTGPSDRGSYRWQAALNRTTGLAGAKETTLVPVGSALHWQLCCGHRKRSSDQRGGGGAVERDGKDENDNEYDKDDDSRLLRLTEQWARRYPLWLCTGPVTYGLFRAIVVTGDGSGGKRKRRTVEIRTRLGNLTLLTFGPTVSHRITYREGVDDNGDSSIKNARHHVQTSHCTVILPVIGGALALPSPPKGSASSAVAAKDRGALVFSLKKLRRLPSSAPPDDKHDKHPLEVPSAPTSNERDAAGGGDSVDTNAPQPRRPSSRTRQGGLSTIKKDDKDYDEICPCQLVLSTTIVGYRPWLAGSRLPIPRWRQALYLGSQSVLHAWIMWRSHHNRCYAWDDNEGSVKES